MSNPETDSARSFNHNRQPETEKADTVTAENKVLT
jgi:hypothetical protein